MKKLKVGIIGYGIVGKRRRIFIDQNDSLETAQKNKYQKLLN